MSDSRHQLRRAARSALYPDNRRSWSWFSTWHIHIILIRKEICQQWLTGQMSFLSSRPALALPFILLIMTLCCHPTYVQMSAGQGVHWFDVMLIGGGGASASNEPASRPIISGWIDVNQTYHIEQSTSFQLFRLGLIMERCKPIEFGVVVKLHYVRVSQQKENCSEVRRDPV